MLKPICLFGGILFSTLLILTGPDVSCQAGAEDALLNKRIVFYNVENLFYPGDDSLKDDTEFTPPGAYHWTYYRYIQKIKNIAQVLISMSEEGKPAVIGLCEIENRRVLDDLNRKTFLKNWGYRIIHQESDDPRGIDVALLYDPEVFSPESYSSIRIYNQNRKQLFTRSILKVTGIFCGKYRCHFFVNHWPSRRGGQKASEPRRFLVARHLRNEVDKIFEEESHPNIIIMGDFNDEPPDKSLKEILRAREPAERQMDPENLINLMFDLYKSGSGSHYRKNNFIESSVLDQFIV
ncbi:MAG: endonuclease/exonuclease/phosphatase family protein [Cyclobacteriaceae bacterium]|nr:endonuclease/exonuclease/phosphatase family protein [Cyclobacteriaceae bacterium]